MNPRQSDAPVVYIVDDDDEVRKSLGWLIESIGIEVASFASASDFLGAYDDKRPACIVLDIRLPGISGLLAIEAVRDRDKIVPIIVLSGYADVPSTVRAMKAGAVDVVQKPYNAQQLLDLVQQSIERNKTARRAAAERRAVEHRLARLTPREREVLTHLVRGLSNREISKTLGISVKTVEVHRGNITAKLEAHGVADLVRLGLLAGLGEND